MPVTTTALSSRELTTDELRARTIHRRAVEAVIWGVPAVNYELMRQAFVSVGGAPNQVVYWSRPVGWKNQTLTPNPDTIYFMPFFNTRDVGPVVLEIPPAEGGTIVGSVDDCWQTAIEDVGPAGVDKGTGGKYLILPPDYKEKVPDGYIAMPSPTYQSFALLRSNYQSSTDADIAKAVTYGKRVRVYPLSKPANRSETTFIDAIDAMFDSTISYDARFFDALNRIVQIEPWLTRDKAMIDTLKSIGIEKGKPFKPDAGTRAVLDEAAAEAHAWIRNRLETSYFPAPYFDGGHWHVPASSDVLEGLISNFANPDTYAVDGAGSRTHSRFSVPSTLAQGQFYLMATRNRAGARARWRQHLSTARSRGRASQSVLVRDRVRRRDPRAYSSYRVVQSVLERHGSREEPRWLCRHFASGRWRLTARSRTGFRRSPAEPFEVLFGFYGPESRCSTRRGRCRTSSESTDTAGR
jgi:hypothetical protein